AAVAARGERAIARIDRMVRDVLDFAQGHLGTGIPIAPMETDMAVMCSTGVEDARAGSPPRTIPPGVRGEPPGCSGPRPGGHALGSRVWNARQHGTDPIGVRGRDEGRFVITEIENGGPPIPPELMRRMFEPFQHRVGTTGLGLGLFIARAIAVAHGGVCQV